MKTVTKYNTIRHEAQGIYKEKGSRFLGFAIHVESENQARAELDVLKKKYHDARHHCYAWMLGHEGDQFRMNDDGEPSGTAGKPILGQITSRHLTYVMVVVVRYFGGTLLGTGGLSRAYREAAYLALDSAGLMVKQVTDTCRLHFGYEQMNPVMKLLKDFSLKPLDQQFEKACTLRIEVPLKDMESFINRIAALNGVKVSKK